VNWWTVFLILTLALVGAAFLGPRLLSDENQRAWERLNEVIRAWEGIRDLQAEVILLRPGEPALHVQLLYLAGLAVRLEIKEPEELAGEVYALRAVPEGWLLVHSRPKLSLGLEARFPEDALGKVLGELGFPSLGKSKVTWPKENAFQITGLAGPFTTVEVEIGENFSLPNRIVILGDNGQRIEIQVHNAQVNKGLELRDLLLLEPLPTRWIPIPIPEGGA
jgi:hypothetical protein